MKLGQRLFHTKYCGHLHLIDVSKAELSHPNQDGGESTVAVLLTECRCLDILDQLSMINEEGRGMQE